ncbi:MAG TPA: lysine--tRNA ligase [Candidatus Paceibacterota bacterium]|nr:lysine--tRNA ligase [Candidatus Paceibacterota bacterium]HPT17829.1 lysine--tRNA ligase [Candidatus Paceibacterota bacterium]
MSSIEEIRNVRIEKLNLLKKKGINPYSAESKREISLKEVIDNFDELEKKKESKWISGRIMSIRGQGAIVFITLFDGTANFQALFKKDVLSDEKFELFNQTVDIGDFVEVYGTFFVTKRGEKTIETTDWNMLTKTLLPLPEKWHGLQDIEEIYRSRYLDLVMDSEAHELFITRAKIVKAIREYLDNKNLLEVETPILQNQAGGAMAKVFETYHNDYAMDMVLRIALELEHKKIMAGGYQGVYEIGKCFRNEGSDPTHIQEFTMLEWYAAYKSLKDNIAWTEEMIKHIAFKIIGKKIYKVWDKDGNDVEVNFDTEWPRVKFGDLLKENAKIDISKISSEEVKTEAIKWGMPKDEAEKTGKANLLDFIYKKSSRHKIINPTFVTNFPGELKPLAQQNLDGTANVAQLVIAGSEITNQYAELVDPILERELLMAQAKAKEEGDEEAMEVDESFLSAMEHGMPPMTGFGMGIDRLTAILTERKNLRDVIFFPIMKPKN